MGNYYYAKLLLSIVVTTALALGYFLFRGTNSSTTYGFVETQYSFASVDHAIQPIPTIKAIDKGWLLVGKALFHSNLLSRDNTISCASCHLVDFGGDDGFSVSTGVGSKQGTRNSPTVINAVFNFRQFWDGRAQTLQEQIQGPVHNPVEMASSWPEIEEKIAHDPMFARAFAELGVKEITSTEIVKALVVFEQSLITPNSAIDRYLTGDASALTAKQKRGLQKFTELGCITCHQGRNIGGNVFQKFGRISDLPEHLTKDKGKFEVSNNALDMHVFKVPSLRNILKTAPYFHDGSVQTVEEAISIMARVQLAQQISDADVDDIKALFESFDGKLYQVQSQ